MAFYDNYVNRLRDALQDSPLVIELKSRYSNLEPRQQQIIGISLVGAAIFLVLAAPLSLFFVTASLESQVERYEDDANYLSQVDAEIRELNRAIALQGQNVDTSVTAATPAREAAVRHLTQASVNEDGYTIQDATQPDTVSVSLARVTLMQLRKFLFNLETSAAGLDITQLNVEMRPEAKGYIASNVAFRKRAAAKAEPAPAAKKSFSR